MKKILLISNMYPSNEMPHYGVFVYNTAKLLEKNYEVDTVILHKENSKIIKLLKYVVWYLKTLFKGIFGKYDCIYNHFVWINAPLIILIKKLRPQIVLVENAHGGDLFSDDPKLSCIEYWARKVLAITDYLIVPSSYYIDVAVKLFGFPRDRILASPSGGVNADTFIERDKKECCAELGLTEDKFWYAFASRIDKDKGWDTFVKAIKIVVREIGREKIHAVMIGAGSQEDALHKLIQDEGIGDVIDICPPVTQNVLAKYYNAVDVYCFPTKRISDETLGLVGLEAMACGTICAISDIPGPRSYANDKNCLLFDCNSVEDCARQLICAYRLNPSERTSLKEMALETAEQYKSPVVEKQINSFFKAAIK